MGLVSPPSSGSPPAALRALSPAEQLGEQCPDFTWEFPCSGPRAPELPPPPQPHRKAKGTYSCLKTPGPIHVRVLTWVPLFPHLVTSAFSEWFSLGAFGFVLGSSSPSFSSYLFLKRILVSAPSFLNISVAPLPVRRRVQGRTSEAEAGGARWKGAFGVRGAD